MKRAVFATLLAVAGALAPSASPASSLTAGVCQMGGQVYYSNPVTTLPDATNYSVVGSLTCIENADLTSAPGARLYGFTGYFNAQGSGSIGCAFSQGGGDFTLEYPTGTNKRDIWEGEFQNAGTALSVLEAKIARILHQTWNGTTWVTSSTSTPDVSEAAGEFVFTVDDPMSCGGAGFTIRDVIGNIAYTYAND